MLSKDRSTFSDILAAALDDLGIRTYRQAEQYLKEQGIDDVSFRRISEYKLGTTVPSFEKAKSILTAFGVMENYSEDGVLERILEKSRMEAHENKDYYRGGRSGKKSKTIIIDFSTLIKNKPIDNTTYQPHLAAENMMEDRIEDLFGNRKRFSAYVNHLIRKDMEEYILGKEDVESKEDNK